MVFTCKERSKKTPKAAPPPNPSPVVALELPTFKWAVTRRLRCQLGNDPDGSCDEDGLFSATAQPLPLAVVDEGGLMINLLCAFCGSQTTQ